MTDKKYLLLENNYMAFYTTADVEDLENVVIFHSRKVSKNRLTSLLYNIHNSAKISHYIKLPFKGVWDSILFKDLLKRFTPDYIVFTSSWYSDHLTKYFRKNTPQGKLILRFSDMVVKELRRSDERAINKLKGLFDGVIAYSQEDAETFGFTYHSVGYSKLKEGLLTPKKQYDVVFVGADKGRIDKIRNAYNKFRSAGLSCYFYVILVKEEDRKDDGIIYADKVMPFCEYLSYENSAKCLFELVQEGSTGRTYRMMESIIYNKLLITNCPEIKETEYYKPEYVQLFEDVSEIDPSFVKKAPDNINYCYKGDFSPIRDLEFIEANW